MLKRQLPCATISGRFAPTRCAKNLQEHSGFICLDIDAHDNPHIKDWVQLKAGLAVLLQLAYAGLSVSGNGVFMLVPISYPDLHRQHFLQLVDDFKQMVIHLDRNCGDVCRLRTKSFDPHPLVNLYPTIYNKVKMEQHAFVPFHRQHHNDDVLDKVSTLCEQIERSHTDITSTYEEWVKVGFSLASLGEQGRKFFHVCSRQNEKYNTTDTDKKFNSLLRGRGGITIATFFQICKDHGVSLSH